jgi:hypothetical protein
MWMDRVIRKNGKAWEKTQGLAVGRGHALDRNVLRGGEGVGAGMSLGDTPGCASVIYRMFPR